MRFTHLVAAAVRRDFALARSYRMGFGMDIAGSLFTLTLVFGMGRLVAAGGRASSTGTHYFAFAVLGLVLLRLAQTALSAQAVRVRTEQTTGTLEALLAGPAPAWQVVVAGSSYDLAQATATSLVVVALAVTVFGLAIHAAFHHVLVALAAFLASLLFVAALGLALAAFTVVFKQVTALVGFLVAAVSVLSGVYFPLNLLPAAFQAVGGAIPLTWGLQILRAGLLDHRDRWDLLLALCVADAVFCVLALWLIERAVAWARRAGALGQY